MAAVTEANSAPTYDSALTSAVNKLSENVLGKKLFANFRGPNKYTGNCKYSIHFFNVRFPKIFTFRTSYWKLEEEGSVKGQSVLFILNITTYSNYLT